MLNNYVFFILAAMTETTGCYTFWMWLRLDRSMIWLAPGIISLAVFAWALTRIELNFAGRAYAAYGGNYIVASLLWLSAIERARPSLTDILGTLLCLLGTSIILAGCNHS